MKKTVLTILLALSLFLSFFASIPSQFIVFNIIDIVDITYFFPYYLNSGIAVFLLYYLSAIILIYWNFSLRNRSYFSGLSKLSFLTGFSLAAVDLYYNGIDLGVTEQLICIFILFIIVIIGQIKTTFPKYLDRLIHGISIGVYSIFIYSICIVLIDCFKWYSISDQGLHKFFRILSGTLLTPIHCSTLLQNVVIILSFVISIFYFKSEKKIETLGEGLF